MKNADPIVWEDRALEFLAFRDGSRGSSDRNSVNDDIKDDAESTFCTAPKSDVPLRIESMLPAIVEMWFIAPWIVFLVCNIFLSFAHHTWRSYAALLLSVSEVPICWPWRSVAATRLIILSKDDWRVISLPAILDNSIFVIRRYAPADTNPWQRESRRQSLQSPQHARMW